MPSRFNPNDSWAGAYGSRRRRLTLHAEGVREQSPRSRSAPGEHTPTGSSRPKVLHTAEAIHVQPLRGWVGDRRRSPGFAARPRAVMWHRSAVVCPPRRALRWFVPTPRLDRNFGVQPRAHRAARSDAPRLSPKDSWAGA
jgi:hypothetical protein